MCGLTADISNVKLWATSDLCGEPPVSSYSSPPDGGRGRAQRQGQPEDRHPARSTSPPPPPQLLSQKGHPEEPSAFIFQLNQVEVQDRD